MSAPVPKCPTGSNYFQFVGCLDAITGARQGNPTCPSGHAYTPPQWGTPGIGTCEVDPTATSAAQQQAVAAATASAQASVDRYALSFTTLQAQKNQLQKTLDVMTSAKGLYSGVSDDLHYSVDEFTRNISNLQNEINITNRKITPPKWWPWLDMFLNVMLVLVLLYAIYVLVSKLMYVRPVVQQFQYAY
jgi:flagellar biosynthesis/type III secretory pathway M-ring protein FliF/YscJ